MTSSSPPPKSEATDCQETDPDSARGVCGAAAVAHHRCLAHLTREQLTAYLATLGPGSDIHAGGVKFSHGLLAELLRPFRHGQNATVGAADFSGAAFADSTLFSRVFFRKGVDFSRAAFAGYVRFSRVSFRERVNFSEATFAGYAHFFHAHFLDDVDFSITKFSGAVRFSRSTFKRADFSHARFDGSATFLCQVQELVLTGAGVSKELTMEAAAGAVDAGNLRGGGRISMRLRAARVDLSGLVFSGPVSVHALQQPLDWDESSLADPVTGVPPVRVVSLAGADAGRLVLTDVDLTERVIGNSPAQTFADPHLIVSKVLISVRRA